MMKKIIPIILLFISSVISAAEFDEMFDMGAGNFSRLANRVTQFFAGDDARDKKLLEDEMQYLSESLLKLESQHANNPVYWFVRGLHEKNLHSFYLASQSAKTVDDYRLNRIEYYKKAMALDKENEPHLSAAAYAAMKAGLPERLKQQAIKAELELGGSGENESYYWYLHWSNINELQKQQRFDEADQALTQMKKELAEGDRSDIFNSLVEKVEKELEDKKSQTTKPAAKKSVPVRDHKAFTEDDVDEQYYRYLLIIGLIMLLLIIIAVVFELNRRKRK